ncbi:MAG: hypothetical protein C0405_13390, partial [Desulfovibrio sp.]|nr:hypothetical protein [Desulfovibrio sp.]
MGTSRRLQIRAPRACAQAFLRPAIRFALLGLLGVWLFCAGGCAMLPFALTTASSFALPQSASLAMSGVKGIYQTAHLAA